MTGNDALPTRSSRSRPPALTKWERWLLAGLLVFTLVVRGAVLWGMRGNLEQDPDAYREIAENLLVHGEFALGRTYIGIGGDWQPQPTAYRPPLYPVVLSNLPAVDGVNVSLAKVAVLHLCLGIGSVWLTWATARRLLAIDVGPVGLTYGPIIAGLIVACDPILLNQQALVMTETLAAFLAILSLWCLARFDGARTPFNAAMAGGAIGLAVLCRPTFLPWLGLVGAGMMVVRSSSAERGVRNAERGYDQLLRDFGWRVANTAGLIVVAAGVLSPWAIHNSTSYDVEKPIVTTTHGGYTLRLGNNPQFYQWLKTSTNGLPWDDSDFKVSEAEDVRLTSPGRPFETFWDNWNYRRAVHTIQTQPVDFVRACFYRIGQLWSPLPNKLKADESMGRRLLRYGTCAWYCGVYLLAVMGVLRLRWRLLQSPWVWGVLMCLVFTAVHTFYWSNLRMRAPLMPFVALVAASAISKKES